MSQQEAKESRVPQLVGITVSAYIFSSLFALARVYSRAIISKNWGIDDTVISTAWFFQTIFLATSLLYVRFGAGHHAFLQSLSDKRHVSELAFFSRILYQTSLTLVKIAICTCYLRIFQMTRQKYIVYGFMALIFFTWLPLVLFDIFACTPVSAAWTTPMMVGCKKFNPSISANAVLSVATDCLMLAFVLYHIYHLKMRSREKLGLVFLVSLSLLSIAAAITRVILVSHVRENLDFSWDVSRIETCSFTEVAVGLFCASAIGINPLLRKLNIIGPTENYMRSRDPSNHITMPWINDANGTIRRCQSRPLDDVVATRTPDPRALNITRTNSSEEVDLEDATLWGPSASMTKYSSREMFAPTPREELDSGLRVKTDRYGSK